MRTSKRRPSGHSHLKYQTTVWCYILPTQKSICTPRIRLQRELQVVHTTERPVGLSLCLQSRSQPLSERKPKFKQISFSIISNVRSAASLKTTWTSYIFLRLRQ